MLPKQNRLNKKEVEDVFKKGKIFKGRFLILKILQRHLCTRPFSNFLGDASKFAVVVPVKVFKKNTERNKIKRLVRESLREKITEIKPGFDGIFMALQGIASKNYWEIMEEVKDLLRKTKLLRTKSND